MTVVKVGNLAPAFNLLNQDGKKVQLKDFRGKKNVVLYFYPKALTPGCTTQACGIRDSKKELAKRNCVAFGISPDPVDKLAKFAEKYSLNFDLLADDGHKIAEKYGVWGDKKFMGREYVGLIRTTFIISKQGKTIRILDKFKTKTHHEDVLQALDELS
ncbi:thioredoxin-dependent thiol peroxidase [Aurantivibrio infirmus]